MNHVKKPDWLKVRLGSTNHYAHVGSVVKTHCLNTICSSGRCPNQAECWSNGTASFMILGNICTRNCKFCNTATGKPLPPNANEPAQIADAIRLMDLKHAVVTSVTRDDLADYGAKHWANCIKEIQTVNTNTTLEVLIPDFKGESTFIEQIIQTRPHTIAHNIETVRRLTPTIRSAAKYDTSLAILNQIAKANITAKSGLMLGLGETEEEIIETLKDLREVGCTVVTIGQYLQPTRQHHPVAAYIHPNDFERYKALAIELGFTHAESGPLVRSSYHAEQYAKR